MTYARYDIMDVMEPKRTVLSEDIPERDIYTPWEYKILFGIKVTLPRQNSQHIISFVIERLRYMLDAERMLKTSGFEILSINDTLLCANIRFGAEPLKKLSHTNALRFLIRLQKATSDAVRNPFSRWTNCDIELSIDEFSGKIRFMTAMSPENVIKFVASASMDDKETEDIKVRTANIMKWRDWAEGLIRFCEMMGCGICDFREIRTAAIECLQK